MINLTPEQHDALFGALAAVQTAFHPRRTVLTEDNYDGTACKSVAELASANQCTELKAAVYAVQNLEGAVYQDACQFMKAFSASDTSGWTSTCVMLTFDRPTALQLSIDGGDPWDQMHVTLAFFGEADQLDDEDKAAIRDACALVAAEYKPFVAKANGITRFSSGEEDSEDAKDAIVVNIDSYQVTRIRETLMTRLATVMLTPSLAHGFTPHCTLGWIDADVPMPVDRWAPMDARIVSIEVWEGSKRDAIPLGTPYIPAEDPPNDEREVAITPAPVVPPAPEDGKDVYRGAGSVPNRGTSKRRKEIIRRARGLLADPTEERKCYLQ